MLRLYDHFVGSGRGAGGEHSDKFGRGVFRKAGYFQLYRAADLLKIDAHFGVVPGDFEFVAVYDELVHNQVAGVQLGAHLVHSFFD